MNLSDLIKELQSRYEKYGECTVVVKDDLSGDTFQIVGMTSIDNGDLEIIVE